MTQQKRSFKTSKVDVNGALKQKEANDEARVLEKNYKIQIESLKNAASEMISLANKYIMILGIEEVSQEIEIIKTHDNLKDTAIACIEEDFFIQECAVLIYNGKLGRFSSHKKIDILDMEHNAKAISEALKYYNNTIIKNFRDLKYQDSKLPVPIQEIEEILDKIDKNKLLELCVFSDDERKIIAQCDALENSQVDTFRNMVTRVKALEQKTGLGFRELLNATAEYKTAVDNFLDIYSDILAMDPRNEDEKSKGFKEYVTKVLRAMPNITETLEKLQEGNFSEAANNIAEGAVDAITALKDDAVSFFAKSFSYLTSLIPSFTTQEDKKFFESMANVSQNNLTESVLNHASTKAEEEQSIVSEVAQESDDDKKVSLPNVDLSQAIKLTDSRYKDAIHNNHQAEVKNMVEVAKAQCIETGAVMQRYVIQNCKGNNALNAPEQCEKYNNMADLMIKNCGYMFPMETSYDAVLNKHLQQAVDEEVIISDQGILYIGAGEATGNQQHYTPQFTAEDAIEQIHHNNAQTMLEGGSQTNPLLLAGGGTEITEN